MSGLKSLALIWARRDVPRLTKELAWRKSVLAKEEKALKVSRRQIEALEKMIKLKVGK